MHLVDWIVVIGYLGYVVFDGIRRSRATEEVRGYFLANRSLPWWAVGLSIMATQMSAITLVGTTGQAYDSGMRFIQFYFGLPFAMIILCVTVVPFFYRANVFTAYEYLENRFDAKTRSLTSFFFLVSRGLSCGVIISAPAVILSIVLGWNLEATVLAIGLPTVLYTMLGGVQAVTWADVKQMVVIFVGMAVVVIVLVSRLPEDVSLTGALGIAGAVGHLETIDLSFDLSETYTFWSGMLGGLFLMLSYFGCDQSQVQRFLTAKSVSQGRTSLLMSAVLKIPMQFVILLIGVLVFVFFHFNSAPLLFNPVTESQMRGVPEYRQLEAEYEVVTDSLRTASSELARNSGDEAARSRYLESFEKRRDVRSRAVELVKSSQDNASYNDVNYVFPAFVTRYLPIGVVGLIIAAIFAAAMSSIAAELNSLATASVMDFYRRHYRKEAPDRHYLLVSKVATAFWGLMACGVAIYAVQLGSLIEVVNKFGSFFYGSVLGVFILAIGTRWATSNGAFFGLLAGMTTVGIVSLTTEISFLWYNVVGAVAVIATGLLFAAFERAGLRR
ncbi:MAG: sodium:solute symporter [Acidobacteriota bacterium]|nr:MAG: sodium:solute symporter [Acidobacteriota bacterium]